MVDEVAAQRQRGSRDPLPVRYGIRVNWRSNRTVERTDPKNLIRGQSSRQPYIEPFVVHFDRADFSGEGVGVVHDFDRGFDFEGRKGVVDERGRDVFDFILNG